MYTTLAVAKYHVLLCNIVGHYMLIFYIYAFIFVISFIQLIYSLSRNC